MPHGHLQARRLHALLQPARRTQQVAVVVGQRGDGGDGHQVQQLAVVGIHTPADERRGRLAGGLEGELARAAGGRCEFPLTIVD